MCANRKNPRTACIIVTTEESISPQLAEVADVELDVRALDPDQRVESVGLAPGEPAAQLDRRTERGCARSTGPGTRPPRAGPASWRRAGTAEAWLGHWRHLAKENKPRQGSPHPQ